MKKNRLSLKIKLIFSFWAALIIALAIPSYYFLETVEEEMKKEMVQSVGERMSILAWALARNDFQHLEELDAVIREIARTSVDRITVIDSGGRVLVDSMVPLDEIRLVENHGFRPEFLQAVQDGHGYSIRHSRTVDRHLIYYARKTDLTQFGAVVLRMATPYATMESFFMRVSTVLWQMMLLSLILAGLLVFLLVRRLTLKLQPMISLAQAIGGGNYATRITVSPGKEFDPLVVAINDMAQNIESNIDLVSAQKTELRTILDGIKDDLVALDNNGRIMSFNRAFVAHFNHHENFLGKRPLEVFLNNELQECCDEVIASDSVRNKSLEIKFREKDYAVNIVSPEDRKRIGAILVFHDITHIRRLESIRKDFVANASHELRTPLTSIKGYTETLLENRELLEKRGAEFLEIITRNTNNMIRLLDDILQLSKIESEPEKIVLGNVALQPVIENSWRNCGHYADHKHIRFSMELHPDCAHVIGEAEALRQVLQNLFENSIKYVPVHGEIKVICRKEDDRVLVGVQDNGPGIPREEQQRVFERFYRVKKFKNKVKGTGLGLAICKNIIRNLGGEIWVQSPVPGADSGSIFWFSLRKSL
ncbi:two-component system, OmpR family, phosphate regulon sensor histidine kinase PhoR [Desulfonatronum thiosulfatophilum]|uniref:histidine kinase n=1 Tax=Desulfonatronum thiosulfatophilum TaxID=617002 RepID=A0A1G6DJ65_9BACT|nr:ATP-binding protein [Desulfonatronum thiosulfatophilum]SDB45141.1 two-component system, OmpR family, phosphate regulon sensor histidine kinase PhoR [Desulfonatronum thiosulfatophilum]